VSIGIVPAKQDQIHGPESFARHALLFRAEQERLRSARTLSNAAQVMLVCQKEESLHALNNGDNQSTTLKISGWS